MFCFMNGEKTTQSSSSSIQNPSASALPHQRSSWVEILGSFPGAHDDVKRILERGSEKTYMFFSVVLKIFT